MDCRWEHPASSGNHGLGPVSHGALALELFCRGKKKDEMEEEEKERKRKTSEKMGLDFLEKKTRRIMGMVPDTCRLVNWLRCDLPSQIGKTESKPVCSSSCNLAYIS